MPTKKTDLTSQVLACIKSNSGVTVQEIASQLNQPKDRVKVAVNNLSSKDKIDAHSPRRSAPAKYTAAYQKPSLSQPVNGPGCNLIDLGKLATPTDVPHRNSTTRDVYDGAELRPFDSRPGANDHMQHGSVSGGQWNPYTPPGLMCVGVPAQADAASSARRRFAT